MPACSPGTTRRAASGCRRARSGAMPYPSRRPRSVASPRAGSGASRKLGLRRGGGGGGWNQPPAAVPLHMESTRSPEPAPGTTRRVGCGCPLARRRSMRGGRGARPPPMRARSGEWGGGWARAALSTTPRRGCGCRRLGKALALLPLRIRAGLMVMSRHAQRQTRQRRYGSAHTTRSWYVS